MTWLALKLSHKWHDFWKKSYGRIVCVCVCGFFLNFIYKQSETVLIQRSIEFDFIQTAQTSPCKVSAILITLQ